ncbi:hypothetical protein SERLA73DRAFT_85050 [Serpula lacrymans var. lacrymans S7.3]|uniref:Uncharacterized protein n=1 Tax=Serpula lacrymans var. lacrymans (strain S7.3) TaxID=936435 RepID=F8PPJ4_SERL3|nr:hypothetical protein SERLA73DRAFT_85050 [Serpula lacrymans var. lacrymans S7.3]
MASNPSAKFMCLYASLPPDVQSSLVERQLVPLLDLVSKDKSKKIVASASRHHKKFSQLPSLDLKAKRAEINGLLDELNRDSKRSFVKERSNVEELLMETIDSLLDWLNNIWQVVYEFRTNYSLAHTCLLFASDVLENIANARTGCKCSFMHLFVPVVLKKMSGKNVKSWAFTGAHHIDEVLLWIWRDLFVTLLAYGSKQQKKAIPGMLNDIQNIMGWKSLERILYGGKKPDSDGYCEEMDDVYSEDMIDGDGDDDDWDVDTDDDDSSDCSDDHCLCGFHSIHWSKYIKDQRIRLRDLVHDALVAVFKVTPSAALYSSLGTICADEDAMEELTSQILVGIATHSSENFAAALNIFSIQEDSEKIVSLLNSHSQLLRPRDAPSLQLATLSIANDPSFQLYALQVLEKELLDSCRTIRAALISGFCRMESEKNKSELMDILALQYNSLPRKSRVEHWVEAVITPPSSTPHPMALAAMMMGLPLPAALDDEDGDTFSYLDIDREDPDLDDLRDEFRPKMKERLEGWIETGRSIKGGPAVLLTAYKNIVELIPCIQASDIVDEMLGRLSDKPSKLYVCDALESLNKFCKQQKKRMVVNVKGKRSNKSTASASASRGNTLDESSSSPPPLRLGGMDDVD